MQRILLNELLTLGKNEDHLVFNIAISSILMSIKIIKKLNDRSSRPEVFLKRCSENTQQIYKRTPTLKCDFNKVALKLY